MNCPKCGREIRPTDKFCIACGAKLENHGEENENFNAASMRKLAGETVNHAAESLMGTSRNGIDFMVRRYFFGFGDFIAVSICAFVISLLLKLFLGHEYLMGPMNKFGYFCSVIEILAFLVFVVSLEESMHAKSNGRAKTKVDEATQEYISELKSRAIEKFNVDEEQLEEVEPVVIAGAGTTPRINSLGNTANAKKIVSLLERFYSKDPFEAYRVDKDAMPRYLLIQTTVYAFTDTQLLVYVGNIDISTGMIYDETVSEVFYSDVNSLVQQELLKKYNKKYYTVKYLMLDICGISKIAAFDTRLVPDVNERLAGMESYIREKKN